MPFPLGEGFTHWRTGGPRSSRGDRQGQAYTDRTPPRQTPKPRLPSRNQAAGRMTRGQFLSRLAKMPRRSKRGNMDERASPAAGMIEIGELIDAQPIGGFLF